MEKKNVDLSTKQKLITVDCSKMEESDDGNTTHYGGTIIVTNHLTDEKKEYDLTDYTDRSLDNPMMTMTFDICQMLGMSEEDAEDIVEFPTPLDQAGKVVEVWGLGECMEDMDPDEYLENLEIIVKSRFQKTLDQVLDFLHNELPDFDIHLDGQNIKIEIPERFQ